MSDYEITSKSLLSLFKERVLAKTNNSTIYFYGAYILKENIFWKRIIIDVLFVYLNKYDTLDFMMETCFDIFKYIEEGRMDLLIPLYRKGLDFSIKIKPHFLTLTEFKQLPKENKRMIEEKRISYYEK